ncbi:SOS response-associated peptidase family protein [Roseovarius salis]|uniref:SOS response-associated peptidase n=1 Tax=Roseovarius salis TaxID=3376063 RepID=UPI0037C885D5
MCNLHSNTTTQEAMRQLFDVAPARDRLGNFAPLPAIYPRYSAPVVRLDGDGTRELVAMHWGFLLPQVSKKTGKPILPKAVNNARDDKVRHSRFWADSFDARRCLVPATSFAEAKGRNPATFYWFGLAGDDGDARPLFAFAGMWRRFRGQYRGEQVEIDTHTIITTGPNELVRPVHPDRMPVIIAPADHETWLRGDPDEAAQLMRPFPAGRMRIVRKGEGVTADPS